MSLRFSRLWLVLAFPVAAALGACTEDLEVGESCPLLCPGQDIVIRDTVLEPAYVLDTTLVGFPIQGLESPLLLADRGDTLDVRAVIRFDSLVRNYLPIGGDTAEPVTFVDSAVLSFRLTPTSVAVPTSFNVEAYDVDSADLADSLPAQLIPLFTPERLLGGVRIAGATFTDSVRVRLPLDGPKLAAIVSDPARRLRIGLKLTATNGAELLLTPYFPGGDGAALEYRVDPDTLVPKVIGLQPSSLTPPRPGFVAGDFVDYSLVVNAPNLEAPGTFRVGGLPGARTYMRFDLPTWLTDSVAVLRARLELTQDPIPNVGQDTVTLLTHLVVANNTVTDLRRAATLLTAGNLFTDALRLVPSDSGTRFLEINGLLRQWALLPPGGQVPTALVLRSNTEGSSMLALRFFGNAAVDPARRPRLRISYTPNKVFGRP